MGSGDVVAVDLGNPVGSEAGFRRPDVVFIADAYLRCRPSVVLVVPLTMVERDFPSYVALVPDAHNGLAQPSWAQVEHMRSVSAQRCGPPVGNVGAVAVTQLLDVLTMIVGAS